MKQKQIRSMVKLMVEDGAAFPFMSIVTPDAYEYIKLKKKDSPAIIRVA